MEPEPEPITNDSLDLAPIKEDKYTQTIEDTSRKKVRVGLSNFFE